MLTIASNFFTAMFREDPFYWTEVVPFAAGWYIWFFLTFPVVYFARRFPVTGPHKMNFLPHIGLFFITNVLQILFSSLLISSLLTWLNQGVYRNILQKTAISGTFYNFLIYGGLLLIVNSLDYIRHFKGKKQIAGAGERTCYQPMNFLKQQLQPHFLFNTHHSIITLMKMEQKDKAIEMMEKLMT
jgi:hypothetical protein